MDNVTHTLIGALVGEAIARNSRNSLPLADRRRLFVPTLAIGSNLPDLDLLYTTLGQGKLDYLLHHRGHTHTIVGALLLSAAMLLLYEWSWRRRSHVPVKAERAALYCAALLGPLLHIAMDAANSYGVHPFWPADNRWRYGDSVFIIEPLFWAAAAPLLFLLQSTLARIGVGLTLAVGVGLSLGTRIVPLPFVCLFVLLSAAMAYIGYRLRASRAAATGVAVWLALTLTFIGASQLADARLRARLAQDFPDERVLDVVRSPLPMNPLCWEVMLVQRPDPAQFTVRRAVFSLAPQLMPASACPTRGLSLPISVPMQAVEADEVPDLQWHGQRVMPRADLVTLARTRCEVRALLQFARVPWVEHSEHAWDIGDLRFDREPGAGFAEVEIVPGRPERCPRWAAPWVPPRLDLLDPLSP